MLENGVDSATGLAVNGLPSRRPLAISVQLSFEPLVKPLDGSRESSHPGK